MKAEAKNGGYDPLIRETVELAKINRRHFSEIT